MDRMGTAVFRLGVFFSFMLVVLLIAFSTNPNDERFQEYLEEKFENQPTQLGVVDEVLNALFSGPTASLMSTMSNRYNFGFFSVYEINFLGKQRVWIGAFNNFIELPQTESKLENT